MAPTVSGGAPPAVSGGAPPVVSRAVAHGAFLLRPAAPACVTHRVAGGRGRRLPRPRRRGAGCRCRGRGEDQVMKSLGRSLSSHRQRELGPEPYGGAVSQPGLVESSSPWPTSTTPPPLRCSRRRFRR